MTTFLLSCGKIFLEEGEGDNDIYIFFSYCSTVLFNGAYSIKI